MDFTTFISLVMTGNGIIKEDIPPEFSSKTVKRTDETDISVFMGSVMAEQKKGNILVVTKNESIVKLIAAINDNLKSNKISVVYNGIPDMSALEEEIRARSLYTADGKTLVPETVPDYPCLVHAGSQVIIKRKPYDNETAVFNSNGETAGVLLDDSIRYENIAGTVAGNINLLSVSEKALLMLEMLKDNISDTVSFSDILLVRTADKYSFIILSSENRQSVCDAELQLFTSMTKKNTFAEIIKQLSELSLPDVLADDIYRIVTYMHISLNTPLPNSRLIKNTMERIVIMEELL